MCSGGMYNVSRRGRGENICQHSGVFICVCGVRARATPCGITKYSSTLYIGMDEVLAHYACTLENSYT